MKKSFKKITSLFIITAVLLASLSLCAFAQNESISYSLRIEGPSSCIAFLRTVNADGNAVTAESAIKLADSMLDNVTVTISTGKVTCVNDIEEKSVGGAGGWFVAVNNQIIADLSLIPSVRSGDKVVLFYGDPYGAGMLFPTMDASALLEDGTIVFAQTDTYTDPLTGQSVTTSKALAGATVTWTYCDGMDAKSYVTDSNGCAVIEEALITSGKCYVQVEKYSEGGMPLSLRLEPETSVEVPETLWTAYRGLSLSLIELHSVIFEGQIGAFIHFFNIFWDSFKQLLNVIFF